MVQPKRLTRKATAQRKQSDRTTTTAITTTSASTQGSGAAGSESYCSDGAPEACPAGRRLQMQDFYRNYPRPSVAVANISLSANSQVLCLRLLTSLSFGSRTTLLSGPRLGKCSRKRVTRLESERHCCCRCCCRSSGTRNLEVTSIR